VQVWSVRAVVNVSLFLTAVCLGQESGTLQKHGASPEQARPNSNLGSFYFGASRGGRGGTQAWLIYIDKAHQSGQIFIAPSMAKSSKFRLSEDGDLAFETEDFSEGTYRFNGTLKAEGLSGWIELVDRKSGNRKYSWEITAAQLPPQNVEAGQAHEASAARFSNVRYVDESGDLVGVDIRFFTTKTGTEGMIVDYEGNWVDPTFTPLALLHVERDSKGVIRFTTESPSGVVRFQLLPTSTGTILKRVGMPHEEGVSLKKSHTALPPIW
jgi:hypothetical protein